jgi:hypothetical protein
MSQETQAIYFYLLQSHPEQWLYALVGVALTASF